MKHNSKWPHIPDLPYRILIIGGFGSANTNVLLNLIKKQYNHELIDTIYLYAEDLNKPKYQLLDKKHEEAGMCLNQPNLKAFIEYLNTMDYVYNNINDYNLKTKQKNLIVFDDMMADINSNKKFQAIIKELFIRCKKLNISLVFITQSYLLVPKKVRLNSTHYLIMRIHNNKKVTKYCYQSFSRY